MGKGVMQGGAVAASPIGRRASTLVRTFPHGSPTLPTMQLWRPSVVCGSVGGEGPLGRDSEREREAERKLAWWMLNRCPRSTVL
jgi:hypothetical protein